MLELVLHNRKLSRWRSHDEPRHAPEHRHLLWDHHLGDCVVAETTEKELYIMLLDGLAKAREASRGLGLKRGDMRWIKVAGMMDQMKDNAGKLFQKAQRGDGVIN